MSEIISDFKDSVKIITPEDGYHYFFAYYDMRATGDGINGRHLCHRVKSIAKNCVGLAYLFCVLRLDYR